MAIPFDVRPITPRIGAEIVGLRLADTLSDETVGQIRQTLVRHRVVFFRDQCLDEAAHVAFARRFGEVTAAHPALPALDGQPRILDLNYSQGVGRANRWHVDVPFVDKPPMGSVLRTLAVPPYGGDTLWADQASAYADLPATLQELANELWAVHANPYVSARDRRDTSGPMPRKILTAPTYEALHPLVRVHPESGERALFLGDAIREIRGLSLVEAGSLLQRLQAYVCLPENTMRWRWRLGDVALWDNRSTQHYAAFDYGAAHRHVQRVTIAGPTPVNIHGQTSCSLRGTSEDFLEGRAVQ